MEAGARSLPLWVTLQEEAELYRRLARMERDPLKASILRLAAKILEDLGDDCYNGYLRRSTLDKMSEVERLLRLHNLPYLRMEKYRSLAVRLLRVVDVDAIGRSRDIMASVIGL